MRCFYKKHKNGCFFYFKIMEIFTVPVKCNKILMYQIKKITPVRFFSMLDDKKKDYKDIFTFKIIFYLRKHQNFFFFECPGFFQWIPFFFWFLLKWEKNLCLTTKIQKCYCVTVRTWFFFGAKAKKIFSYEKFEYCCFQTMKKCLNLCFFIFHMTDI